MAKANERETFPNPVSANGKSLRSQLRDLVRERMRKMAPLALAAAAPLTNAACDPAPTPSCYDNPSLCDQCQGSRWAGYFVRGSATWRDEAGERTVFLDLVANFEQVRLSDSYTLEGGTFWTPPTPNSIGIIIKPDPGAAFIRVADSLTCVGKAGNPNVTLGFVVTVDLLPPDGGSPDADPTVTIERL
jgi:hypothetical protein